MKLYSKEASTSNIVLYTRGKYAVRSYDWPNNPSGVPPITGPSNNTSWQFRSREFGYCEVDWGDGTKETIPLTKVRGQNDYRIIFRSQDCEWRKDPNSSPWWFWKEDGSQYVPVPNHEYSDGLDADRTITLAFTCDIYYFNSERAPYRSFPTLDAPGLETLTLGCIGDGAKDIPEDRIMRSVNLTNISVTLGNNVMKRIPDNWGTLTKLTSINLQGTGDFFDTDSSNLRKLPDMWPNLSTLDFGGCFIKTYPREWLSFNNLQTLTVYSNRKSSLHPTYDPNTMLEMDEIDKINPSLLYFNHMGSWYVYEEQTEWHDYMLGKGLENIVYFDCQDLQAVRLDKLPDYIYEMRSMNNWHVMGALLNQTRMDTFVDLLYDATTNWEQSTMSSIASDGKRNQFYGLTVGSYNSVYPNMNPRPSGILQAPAGFVKGSSNGTPASQLEKIYVLTNNYAQNWVITPE